MAHIDYMILKPEIDLKATKAIMERCGQVHFTSLCGCFLSPGCSISSLLAGADGLRQSKHHGFDVAQHPTKKHGHRSFTWPVQLLFLR